MTSKPSVIRPWTDEEHNTLLEMWLDGETARDIATALDRPYNSVYQRAQRLIAKGELPEERKIKLGEDPIWNPRGGPHLYGPSVCRR